MQYFLLVDYALTFIKLHIRAHTQVPRLPLTFCAMSQTLFCLVSYKIENTVSEAQKS